LQDSDEEEYTTPLKPPKEKAKEGHVFDEIDYSEQRLAPGKDAYSTAHETDRVVKL